MVVTYHGKGYVRASVGSLTLAFNPPSKDSSLKVPKAGADVALVSVKLPDYDGAEQASHGDREPFVIDGPGEYEVQDIFIKGINSQGPDGIINTIYCLTLDDMRICHLGVIATPELTSEAIEAMGEIDILFVPTYDEGTLTPASAHKLATKLGSKTIVPLFYGDAQNDTLKQFLKEEGDEGAKVLEKWTTKRKDIESSEGDVVVIKSF
ncbi:MAG TPA: MBL fold metallo-hydrolase [Candidatus Paceibacterota bacterium]